MEVAIGDAGLLSLGAVHEVFQDTGKFDECGFVLDHFRLVWEHSVHVDDAGWGVVVHSCVGGPSIAVTCFIVVACIYLSSVKET